MPFSNTMSYVIYDRVGIFGAERNGFPLVAPGLERVLGSVPEATLADILILLDPTQEKKCEGVNNPGSWILQTKDKFFT